MRRIDKASIIQPENTLRTNPKFRTNTGKVIAQRDKPPKDRKFNGYANKKIKNALEELYAGGNFELDENGKKIWNPKCAYCESTSAVVASLQVEHYRPKKEVSGDATHKGYYWLAFEWTNLIYACPQCNGQGAKGNHFPISGTRISVEPRNEDGTINYNAFDANHELLIQEQPFLLHPEIDNPQDHLTFLPSGEIKGLTEKGRQTIQICNLNRPLLRKERKKIIDEIVKNLKSIILAFETNNSMTEHEVKRQLKTIFNEITRFAISETYTLFRETAKNKVEEFFMAQIDENFRDSFTKAYDMYLQDVL